ncbi:MAG: tetratricopeptide repeat protein [Bacteroidales bacterium]|nr:tetratricopeptide repeat protein [Bacteroidales bacterium]MCF8314276.1 tetratricopeptide repeat protein [Saprospiraceae bacterium]MCF8443105.1 tetratricopeptide repeat protein [Saprospiraceae bacterium]
MSKRKFHEQGKPVKTVTQKPTVIIPELFTQQTKLLLAGAMAVLAMLVYSPSHNYGFVYDDDAVVKENKYVQKGLNGLEKIWTTSYFQGYDESLNARAYRPIPLTTLAVEYSVWGLNSKVNHIFNLLFYGLIGFFTFLFLSKLLRKFHPAIPIIATLLFVLHPIHLEVIANIKSRDTMLGYLGFAIAAWLLLIHFDSKKWLPLIFSVFFYAFGLFSKEEVLTTVALIPFMLWFFRDAKFGKALITTLPYLVAALGYLFVRSNILGGLNAGIELTELDNSLLACNGFGERTASGVLVLGKYLLMTLFPHPLISDYSLSTLPIVNWNDWRVYISLLGNLGLLAALFHGFSKKKLYSYGALHYFITVSIFTSIVVTNVSAYNDRFLFTPVLGICLILAWAISLLIKKTEGEEVTGVVNFFKNNVLAVGIVAVLAVLSILKIERQLPYWVDRYALFEHDAKLAPNNARMRKNHGGSLARMAVEAQEKDPNLAKQYATKAIKELDAALAIYDKIPTGYIHKGNMYIILGAYDKAEESLKKALEQNPGNYFALTSLGNTQFRMSKYQDCVETMEKIHPSYRKGNDYYILSLCYDRAGNSPKAEENRQKSGK